MKKVHTADGYDFYIGNDKSKKIYNIVPEGSPSPSGGYYDVEYIETVKGVRFPKQYRPSTDTTASTQAAKRKTIKLSKSQWELVGQRAGWINPKQKS